MSAYKYMRLREKIKVLISFFSSVKECYKHGGSVRTNVSSIKYGSMFEVDTLVLITGGSSGIGLEMSKRFIEEGAKVCIVGRNKSKLESVKEFISSPNVFIYAWDVGDVSDTSKRINDIEAMMDGKLSVLINNAGVYAKTQFPNCTSEDWDNVYNINAKGTFFLCQELCKRWMNSPPDNGRARKIINISSQGGFVGANNPYRMTKWDVRGLTEFLGKEMSKYGIIANGIAPGLVLTDMQPEFQKQKENTFTYLNAIKRVGLPLEIAELAIYLASDASNFIVGHTICCDGGYILK